MYDERHNIKVPKVVSGASVLLWDVTVYVSSGGLLTRSGSLVSIEGMSLDVAVNTAVATQHYAGIY